VVMYSISPIQSQKLFGSTTQNYYFYKHLQYAAIGLVAFLVGSRIHYQRWQSMATPLVALAFLAMLVILIPAFSLSQLGATRWLRLGPFSFQPAELMKLALVVYLSHWLSDSMRDPKSISQTVVPFGLILAAVSLIVVVWQKDMGTMMVLGSAAIGVLYVGGVRASHLAGLLASAAIASWVLIAAFPHRVERILAFLKPGQDSVTGASYHISQALIAVGTGGLFGVGLGRSIQVYGYLPEAPNDSIFAIIAEEFGLLGSMVLLAVIGLLVYRAFRVARYAPDNFSRLLATGIGLWIMSQAVINIAAMLALIPLTGIPLPFISFGGSSLIMSMLAVGILVNISKYTTGEESHASRRQRRGDSRAYFAHTGRRQPAKTA
jgi:cell division protein FtsW